MTAQHIAIGKPVHKGEASGINFLVKHLPATHIVVSNVDLPTGQHGRTFDHDVVVIAQHAIFTVELKSWGGLITGNRDRWMLPGSGYTQSPIPLVLHKARVLKSVLSAFRPSLGRVWVQGLVFVSAPDADLQLSRDFEAHARTRDDVIDALTDPREWGLQGRKLDAEQIQSAVEYLADGHPPSARTHYGEFELIERLPAEDKPYDAFRAKTQFGLHRLIHVYPIQGDNEKTRERARNQALREATLAERISGYQDILGWYGEHQFPHDHAVLLAFEDVTPLLPLGTWITERRPGFEERLQLALRITKALCWMHSRKVIHRRLSPESILLDEGSDKLRLTALDLARDLSGQAATLTASRLRDPSYRCMAPELLKGAQASVGTDLFALGAVFFELILERPLFEKAEDALRPFEIPQLHVSGQRVPADFERLVHRLLSIDPAERPETCSEVVEALSECLRVAKPKRKSGPEPIGPGRVIGPYRLTQRLAEGAGGATWKARHLQEEHDWIAKIADAERSDALRTEQGILQSVKHPSLVGYKDILAVDAGGLMLILSFVEGVTGADWAGAGDPLTPAQLERLGKGLLGAVGALHEAGWVHRDVKPANVMLRANAEPVLIDLGLGTLADDTDQLTVGTVDYKDPNVYQLGRLIPPIVIRREAVRDIAHRDQVVVSVAVHVRDLEPADLTTEHHFNIRRRSKGEPGAFYDRSKGRVRDRRQLDTLSPVFRDLNPSTDLGVRRRSRHPEPRDRCNGRQPHPSSITTQRHSRVPSPPISLPGEVISLLHDPLPRKPKDRCSNSVGNARSRTDGVTNRRQRQSGRVGGCAAYSCWCRQRR
ncbi:MAG: NERD domain-containing protein kinase family protein [Myxococcota bacterium]